MAPILYSLVALTGFISAAYSLPSSERSTNDAKILDLKAVSPGLPQPTSTPSIIALGVGTQNYTCNSTTGTYSSNVAVADLYDITDVIKSNTKDSLCKLYLKSSQDCKSDGNPMQLNLIGDHYFDANGKPNITNYEALHRLLIAAAGHGRLETVKVMCEKYDVNVNHVSHKFFSTPLSRAAGQGLYDLQARLGVARYLLEHTSFDPSIAHGDFANGTTPLACAMSQRQTKMIRLLLEFGGPVESIDDDVLRDVERREPGEQVKLCVAYLYQRPRREVRIMSEEACEKAAEEERVDHAMLGWERDELLSMLGRMKIRASNEELQKADPKGRPLAEAV